ncbi:hypothetical protein JMUB5695_03112 [Mycobacterium heckeshornense]|uniref:DUF6011 domain-containing protein n=1 Tax=Mycobacterium heckeshornense TaxID=110505 RepID=UPI0019422C47|nr:DUF6011 domain-containing protein [Mycobacterium heckeshornense]BCQ09662.1 hypothetical protein JMUB5695_03112 [Mycobacterium heckeshornense]
MNRESRTRRPGPALDTGNHRTGRRRQDGYAAPTAEERAEQRVLAAAYRLGYRLAVQCVRCGQWLVAERSVRDHIGPVCRTRAQAGEAR